MDDDSKQDSKQAKQQTRTVVRTLRQEIVRNVVTSHRSPSSEKGKQGKGKGGVPMTMSDAGGDGVEQVKGR